MTMNDAFCYLKKIKDMFPDRREKYHMFLVLMNDFRKKRIDMGYEIILSDEDNINFEGAVSLITHIKTCLGNGHEYKYFLDILFMCEKERKDVKELYRKVVVLLNDHPDLLDEFAKFLSVSSTAKPLFSVDEDKTSMN
ncbi:hypothetical protein MTR67_031732 [Solanum verrucosum]|uniref:Uncharacterized protein n=1 Tax=Solanum verrucosum TaxID=315347 RepID=A0AAF0U2Y6_SOLVR|nr:hypothetical protein MTR67_031732 [Solanum verrucosum]